MFGVYTKDFSDTFAETLSGFHVDDSGNLVSTSGGKQQRLQDLILTPGPYPRGAAWDMAIATADRSVSAFAQVIPQPIAVQSSGCSVSLSYCLHAAIVFWLQVPDSFRVKILSPN